MNDNNPTGTTRTKGELLALLNYFLLTAVTTGMGLALRYILLLFFAGTHNISIFGLEMTVNVNDNLAYTVYYVSSVVFFYLGKWFSSKGMAPGSFWVRFLGYGLLCLVSTLVGNVMLTWLLGLGINSELAFWLTCPVTFLINYLGSRLIVFRDADDRAVSALEQPNAEGS